MSNTGKEFVPLFLNLEDPLAVYIVNNKLVLFNSYGGTATTPHKAYVILQDIVNNKQVDAVFPGDVINLLRKKKPIEAENYLQQNLVGWKEPNSCYLCLDLNLNKDDNELELVHLKNLTFMEHKIEAEIKLSVKDAMFIFANICTNSLSKNYDYKHLVKNEFTINQLVAKQKTKFEDRKDIPEIVKEIGVDIAQFVYSYLEFIRSELKESSVSPQKILNLSGALVLVNALDIPTVFSFIQEICNQLINVEELSSNQLIINYTFLKLAISNSYQIYGSSNITKTLSKFFDDYGEHLDKLEADLKDKHLFSKEKVLKLLGN